MNKTLIIYNNPRIFAQSLSILDNYAITDYDILMNEKYHNTSEQIEKSKNWLSEYCWKTATEKEKLEQGYEYIIRPTPVENDGLWYLYDKFPASKYLYIEEWMWFYTLSLANEKFLSSDKYFMAWDVYLTYPEKFQWAKNFDEDKIYSIVKWWYHKELQSLPADVKTILYTEPKVFDEKDVAYKDKIEQIIKDYPKPLLLKKHFRDDVDYVFWEGVYECPKQVPWQLLFGIYPQAKLIFTWNTTLELYINDKTRIIKI